MPSLFGGGGQRSMVNLAHGMAEFGYAVDLVLAQVEGPFLKDVRDSVREKIQQYEPNLERLSETDLPLELIPNPQHNQTRPYRAPG